MIHGLKKKRNGAKWGHDEEDFFARNSEVFRENARVEKNLEFRAENIECKEGSARREENRTAQGGAFKKDKGREYEKNEYFHIHNYMPNSGKS